jgi:hypothetical protein
METTNNKPLNNKQRRQLEKEAKRLALLDIAQSEVTDAHVEELEKETIAPVAPVAPVAHVETKEEKQARVKAEKDVLRATWQSRFFAFLQTWFQMQLISGKTFLNGQLIEPVQFFVLRLFANEQGVIFDKGKKGDNSFGCNENFTTLKEGKEYIHVDGGTFYTKLYTAPIAVNGGYLFNVARVGFCFFDKLPESKKQVIEVHNLHVATLKTTAETTEATK